MGKVEATTEIEAPLAEVWELYFDHTRWASWVDGFREVVTKSDYPEKGGALRWRTTAAGRGDVEELVTAHEPRSLHRVSYVDPASTGVLEVTFEMLAATTAESGRLTRVRQEVDYRVTSGGPFRALVDFLFIRTQVRLSLERSLADLRLEVERAGGTRAGP